MHETAKALKSALTPAEFQGESEIKRRLRGYFLKYPDRHFIMKQLGEHFNDVTHQNLQYHIRTLVKSGVIEQTKRGVYCLSKKYVSLEQKRAAVAQHNIDNPRVVQSEEGFNPLKPALTIVENPSAVGAMALQFCTSITARMRAAQSFSEADCDFIERLVKERYSIK